MTLIRNSLYPISLSCAKFQVIEDVRRLVLHFLRHLDLGTAFSLSFLDGAAVQQLLWSHLYESWCYSFLRYLGLGIAFFFSFLSCATAPVITVVWMSVLHFRGTLIITVVWMSVLHFRGTLTFEEPWIQLSSVQLQRSKIWYRSLTNWA